MNKNADRFTNGVEEGFKQASRSARRFESVTSSILKASAVQKGLGLLSQGVQQATADFVSFDDSIISASAKFSDIRHGTAEGIKQIEALRKAARKTGAETKFSATQAAEALDFLALSGQNSAQAIASLGSLANLAITAGVENMAEAVDIATDSLGAFGLATKDAAQLELNLARISDVFAKTQATSNTNLTDLFETVKKGAPQFTATGQSLESFAALAGVMANSGVKASESGTQLRNVMLRLGSPTKQAQKQLKKLGVSVLDENKNFRDVIDILGDFEKALGKLGEGERTDALATIFGSRSSTGINILLKQGSQGLRKYRQDLIESKGAAADMAKVMQTSLGNQLKSLASASTELAFKFFDAFKNQGAGGIQALTDAIRKFDPKPIVEGIFELVDIIKNLVEVTRSVIVIMSPYLAILAVQKARIIATALAYKAWTVAIGIYTTVTNAAGIATWAFNTAMAANPIGLLVIGVAALIAGLVLLVKNWDVVKDALINGTKALFKVFEGIWSILKKIVGAAASLGGKVFKSIFSTEDERNPDLLGTGQGVLAPPNRAEAKAKKDSFEGLFRFENNTDNKVDFVTKKKSSSINVMDLGFSGG